MEQAERRSKARMQWRVLWSIIIGLAAAGALAGSGPSAAAGPAPGPPTHQAASPNPVSFQKQIQPLLARRCQGCHQPASRGGKLAVTSYAMLKAGGMSGPAFRPGEPEKSLLVQYVSGPEPKMPKGGPPLPPEQVSLLRRWVMEGA